MYLEYIISQIAEIQLLEIIDCAKKQIKNVHLDGDGI